MVETFTNEVSRTAEHNECAKPADASNLKCVLEVFAMPPTQGAQDKSKEQASEKPTPIKEVPGATLSADGNQYYLNYRGLHVPTWTATNPDNSAAKPYVGTDGAARVDGKLQPVKDADGKVLGADGKPLLDSVGMRRYTDKGEPVFTKYDGSEPAQLKKALDSQGKTAVNEETRTAYNKLIESADKLDRVEMAKTIEANEKFVMSHTTAFLWETAYRQLQQKPGSEEALKAKDAELQHKPSLAENVRRVREGAALDQELGNLIVSSVDTRSAYMARLLGEDSVKQYMSSRDRTLEGDLNVKEARRVVTELSKIDPNLTDKLQPTAKLLGLNDFGKR